MSSSNGIILLLIISTATLIISIINLIKQNKTNKSYKCENYKNITKLTSDTNCITGCQPNIFLAGIINAYIPVPLTFGAISITIKKEDGKDKNIFYPYTRKDCTVTKGTVILQCYSNININDTNFISQIVPFPGITSINIENLPISAELFIDCSTHIVHINRILCDISNNDNLQTIGNITSDGSIDPNTINSINDLINNILYNNSHIFDFNVPVCSYTLETCNKKGETNPNIQSCTSLVNTLNNFIQTNLQNNPYSFPIPDDYIGYVDNALCNLN